MFQLHVVMGDMYGSSRFDIEVPSTQEHIIRKAIEDKYDEWSKALSKKGAGPILVYYKDQMIVNGSIVWWWNGTHSLRLDFVSTYPETMSQDAHAGTSVCHEGYPRKEQSQPTCCAFV